MAEACLLTMLLRRCAARVNTRLMRQVRPDSEICEIIRHYWVFRLCVISLRSAVLRHCFTVATCRLIRRNVLPICDSISSFFRAFPEIRLNVLDRGLIFLINWLLSRVDFTLNFAAAERPWGLFPALVPSLHLPVIDESDLLFDRQGDELAPVPGVLLEA